MGSFVEYIVSRINTAKGLSPDGTTLTGEPLEKVEINPLSSLQTEDSDPLAAPSDPNDDQPISGSQQPSPSPTIKFKRRKNGISSSSSGTPNNAYE